MKLKLSGPFLLLAIALAASIPAINGADAITLATAFGVLLVASSFVERGTSPFRNRLQRGEVGEVKAEVLKALGDHTKTLTDAIAKCDTEIKDYGRASLETKEMIAKLSLDGAALEKRLAAAEQELVGRERSDKKPVKESLGEMVVKSDALKRFCEAQGIDKPGGEIRLRSKRISDVIQVKNITSAANSAGDGIWSFRDPEIVSNPYRPLMLRSLIPTVPVSSNLIEWVKTSVRTNSARAVTEGATKPKSDLTYDRQETAVRKLAHYFKTSAEVLADFPRLRAEINTEGFEMLRQEEEDQLLSGDGTGVNLLGLRPQATVFDESVVASSDQRVDILRRAILQVRQSYYYATGIVMNPADWAEIELMKDGQDRYMFSSPTSGAEKRLWGLPVIDSDAQPEGEFLVGAFATAATIYDRMDSSVFISTENEDDFIKNMVSILFEERIALAVKRELAFVRGNLDGSEATSL